MVDKQKRLIVFTYFFPFSSRGDNAFLQTEIPYLCKEFDEVIIVPQVIAGKLNALPENVVVETGFANTMDRTWQHMLAVIPCLFNRKFWQAFFTAPLNKTDLVGYGRLIMATFRAKTTQKWIEQWINANNFDLEDTLFYTYWLSNVTTGLTWAIPRLPRLKIISRAHRADLYAELYSSPFIPYQADTLKKILKLYTISEHGKNYIDNNYPWFSNRCEVSRLGVQGHGPGKGPSPDGILRITSCSYMIPVKRIDLILKALTIFAEQAPGQKVEWVHIGNGPMWNNIMQLSKKLPGSICPRFLGHLPNEQVLRYFQTNYIDVFINVSASEGIPVSIMESFSFGVPVIATTVGGTTEIVSNENGILLSPDCSPAGIANALKRISSDRLKLQAIVQKCRSCWQDRYDSNKNYPVFAHSIRRFVD
jgi:glycosyltransferase involved in cell wall biosynthesis